MTQKPRAVKGFHVEQRRGKLLLCPAGAAWHAELNDSAARIWAYCDGAHSLDDIVGLLSETFGENEATIRQSVVVCLNDLASLGAIEHFPPSPQPRGPDDWPTSTSSTFEIDGVGDFYVFEDDAISRHIQTAHSWEKYLFPIFEQYIAPGDTIIDAGAYIGTHTAKLARLCAPGRVLAFEPHPVFCNLLRSNIAINGFTNVEVFEQGLSDTSGDSHYAWISAENFAASGLAENPKGLVVGRDAERARKHRVGVSLTTVDQLDLEQIGFMKIDVEGYETKVLRGAVETLARCRPVVVLECWKSNRSEHRGQAEDLENPEPDSPLQFLMELGYRIEPIKGADFLALPQGLE